MACTLAWTLGYALCWVSKWLIAYLLMDIDVFGQAVEKVSFWTKGEYLGQSRTGAVARNFSGFFTMHGKRTMLVPLLPLLVEGVFALCFFDRKKLPDAVLMFLVSLYPYVWYFVLSAHSEQHHWFTFRAQCMTMMGLYLAVATLVNRERMRTWLDALHARYARK